DDADLAGVGAHRGQVPHAHPITDLELRHGGTPSWWFGSLKSRPHRTAAPSPRCPGGKRGRRGLWSGSIGLGSHRTRRASRTCSSTTTGGTTSRPSSVSPGAKETVRSVSP